MVERRKMPRPRPGTAMRRILDITHAQIRKTEQWETCESCGKAKPDVHERIDGYIQDVQNREVLHTVCDACERKGCEDI